MAVIDELITILGFDVTPGSNSLVEQFTQRLERVQKVAIWASAGLTAAAGGALAFVQHASSGAASLEKFRELTHVNTQNLQELAYAAEMAGGSAAGLQGDLTGLLGSFDSPIWGEFNQSMFQFFGGDASFRKIRDMSELLDAINARMQAFPDHAQKFQWSQKLGLSEDTARLVMLPIEQYKALKEEARDFPLILDKDQLKGARDFEKQMIKVHKIIDYMGANVATTITPILSNWLVRLTGYIAEHKEIIQSNMNDITQGIVEGLQESGEMVSKFGGILFDSVPGLTKYWQELDKIEKTAFMVKAALAVLVAAPAFKAIVGLISLIGIPATMILAGVAGGAAGGYQAYKHSDALKDTEAWRMLVDDITKWAWSKSGVETETGSKLNTEETWSKPGAGGDAGQRSNTGIKTWPDINDWKEMFTPFYPAVRNNNFSLDPEMPKNGPVNTIYITQHITGANASQIAEKSAGRISQILNVVSPGAMGPVVS